MDVTGSAECVVIAQNNRLTCSGQLCRPLAVRPPLSAGSLALLRATADLIQKAE